MRSILLLCVALEDVLDMGENMAIGNDAVFGSSLLLDS